MRIYDNAPDSYHDELASWFPTWYRNVLEMDALWNTWGKLLDNLQSDIVRALNNYFLVSCDQETIEFWERFIDSDMRILHSLEFRRRYIMTHFSGFGKCSATMIKGIIRQFTGLGSTVRFVKCDDVGNHQLIVVMENGDVEEIYLHDMQMIIEKVVPAHIPLTVRGAKQDGTSAVYATAAVIYFSGRMNVTAKAPAHRDVETTLYAMAAITNMSGRMSAKAIDTTHIEARAFICPVSAVTNMSGNINISTRNNS